MRIAVYSRFYPSVGGIETLSRLLIERWLRQQTNVVLVSDVPAPPGLTPEISPKVLYRPGLLTRIKVHRQAQLVVHMNISLKALWPALLIRRPFVAVHHGFYVCDQSGRQDWREKLKLGVARRANANIAVSAAVARDTHLDCEVIPNAYDDSLFNHDGSAARKTDLAFVGRLVSDKGADLLLRALSTLRAHGLRPNLTIIGDGPERQALKRLAAETGVAKQVRFTGTLSQHCVAAELRRDEILVVPSLCNEAFAIVALEGAACGCVVLGSHSGGLPEAIGPTGTTFPRGDVETLAEKLRFLLLNPEERERYRSAAAAHLARHAPETIAKRYLGVFRRVLRQ